MSTPTSRRTSPHPSGGPDRDYRRAWWSLALFLPSFVLSFVVGEGLATWYGYPTDDATPPGWVVLAAGLPAVLVFSLPALVVAFFTERARRAGRREAWVPLVVGLVLPLLFLVQNLLAYVVARAA